MIFKALAILVTVALSACGGGSATQSAPPVSPPAAARPLSNVVAFMGDSITHRWDLTQYDTSPTLNFGVSGNTTAQMLARFGDVIAAGPGVVVILGGINDLSVDPASNIDNIKAMAAQAASAGIRVILCSVTAIDANELFSAIGVRYTLTQPEIEAFNSQLIDLARENGYLYADYYDAMLTPTGVADTSLLVDGMHPNPAGYAKMWAVIAPLLTEDLN